MALQLRPLRLLLTALLVATCAAAPSWKKIAVSVDYVGRGEGAVTRCAGDKICLLGGRGSSPVGILDTRNLTWARGKNPPFEIHHFQALQGPDNCAWVVGAWTGAFPSESTVDNILKYCPDTDKWSTAEKIARPRGAGGAVFYNDAVYIVSGNVGGHNIDAKLVPWFDKFDLTTGKWTELEDVPNPRDHFHAVVVDDKLYVAGGRDSTENVPAFFNDVEVKVNVFDFATEKWSTLDNFPRPRGGTFATAFDGTVFVMGGEGQGRAWAEVDALQGTAFVPVADMPVPRHGAGAASCNGAIWVAGGVTVQGGGPTAIETVAYFDGDSPPVCKATEPSTSPTRPPTTSSTTAVATTATASMTAVTTPTPEATTTTVTGVPPTPSPSLESTVTPSPPSLAGPTMSEQPSPSEDTTSSVSGSVNPVESSSAEESAEELAPSSESTESACFPSDASVELRDGTRKTMDQLRIGDHVKVAHPSDFSPVFFFSHRQSNVASEVVRIETSVTGITLSVSPGHLIYVNGRLVPAATTHVGDEVSVSHDVTTTATVLSVTRTLSNGLHNPHTLHGDIIVNNVVASTFTSSVHPSVARMLLAPFRILYGLVGAHRTTKGVNDVVLRALDYALWKTPIAEQV